MMSEVEERKLFTLVAVDLDHGIRFLKRAHLREVLVWAKIFRSVDGLITQSLDLIRDVQILQQLYCNSTGYAPSDDAETLRRECAELSTKLTVDNTPASILKRRIAQSEFHSNDIEGKAEPIMSDQTIDDGVSNEPENGLLAEDSTQDNAPQSQLESQPEASTQHVEVEPTQQTSTQSEPDSKYASDNKSLVSEDETKESITKPAKKIERPKDRDKIFAKALAGEDAKERILEKVQESFLSQKVSKNEKRASDPGRWSVIVPLRHSDVRHSDAGDLEETAVSMVWFASVATELHTNFFYRSDAIGLIHKLGLIPLHDGQPIPEKEPKPVKEKKEKKTKKMKVKDKEASVTAAVNSPEAQNAAELSEKVETENKELVYTNEQS